MTQMICPSGLTARKGRNENRGAVARSPSRIVTLAFRVQLPAVHGKSKTPGSVCQAPRRYRIVTFRKFTPRGHSKQYLAAKNGLCRHRQNSRRLDYRDESGEVLYQVVRYDPKGFRQRDPERPRRLDLLLNGTRRLYGLPELLSSDSIVWLVEGEKDAGRLANLGLIATTAAMGAGKWRSEYSESLRGHHGIIIPDNDKHGHQHAETVRDALYGTVASVAVLELAAFRQRVTLAIGLTRAGTRTSCYSSPGRRCRGRQNGRANSTLQRC